MWLKIADAKGKSEKFDSKLEYVKNYMRASWNIDIDKLREVYLRRENDIVTGKVVLSDISL